MQRPHLSISILLILVLGLHVIPVVMGASEGKWPFLAYSMYRNSRAPGPVWTVKLRLIGVTASGEQLEIDTGLSPRFFNLFRSFQIKDEPKLDLGNTSYVLYHLYLGPMWKGDVAAARQLAARINIDRKDPIIAFRVEGQTYTIADVGLMKTDEKVLTYQVNSEGIPYADRSDTVD